MASAVDQLEALFQRAESDLSYVHRKLDTQLSAKYETIGHGQVRYDSDCLKKIYFKDNCCIDIHVCKGCCSHRSGSRGR